MIIKDVEVHRKTRRIFVLIVIIKITIMKTPTLPKKKSHLVAREKRKRARLNTFVKQIPRTSKKTENRTCQSRRSKIKLSEYVFKVHYGGGFNLILVHILNSWRKLLAYFISPLLSNFQMVLNC